MNRNNIIDELQEYMLNDTNMTSFLKKKLNILKNDRTNDKTNNRTNEKTNDKAKKPEQCIFFPNQQDSLFWCFYIIKNGEFSYESLHNKNSLVSKQMKVNFIDVIRKNKDTVKMYK